MVILSGQSPTDSQGATRRPAKKAIRFSLMVAGQVGLGKSTLLATMFEDQIQPPLEAASPERPSQFQVLAPTDYVRGYAFETEVEGERLYIEAIDTPGFGDDVEPTVRLNELLAYLERAFDEVFEEEQRVHRNPKFEEHRVHALLYMLEPTGLSLKAFDAELMSKLAERVNVIPVIAKADALTATERASFKKRILEDIRSRGIRIFDFEGVNIGGVEDDGSRIITADQHLPFAVVGTVAPRGSKEARRGRPYPWGLVEADNPLHSDLSLLKQALLSLYRDELKEATEDGLYENYRTEKLISKNNLASEAPKSVPVLA